MSTRETDLPIPPPNPPTTSIHIARRTCLDCHFLCQAGNYDPDTHSRPHDVLPFERRNQLRNRIAAGSASIDYNPILACDWGEWREYDSDVRALRLDNLTSDRGDLCFFWPYQPGQTLHSAKIKQQRAEDRAKLSFTRNLAITSIIISFLALAFDIVLRIYQIAMSQAPTPPTPLPYPP